MSTTTINAGDFIKVVRRPDPAVQHPTLPGREVISGAILKVRAKSETTGTLYFENWVQLKICYCEKLQDYKGFQTGDIVRFTYIKPDPYCSTPPKPLGGGCLDEGDHVQVAGVWENGFSYMVNKRQEQRTIEVFLKYDPDLFTVEKIELPPHRPGFLRSTLKQFLRGFIAVSVAIALEHITHPSHKAAPQETSVQEKRESRYRQILIEKIISELSSAL